MIIIQTLMVMTVSMLIFSVSSLMNNAQADENKVYLDLAYASSQQDDAMLLPSFSQVSMFNDPINIHAFESPNDKSRRRSKVSVSIQAVKTLLSLTGKTKTTLKRKGTKTRPIIKKDRIGIRITTLW